MRPLILQICWTGVSISIYTGLIVPIVYSSIQYKSPHDPDPIPYSSQEIFKKSMMVMIGLGVGEIIGGILMGVIVDIIGAKKSSFINCGLILMQTVLVVAYIKLDDYDGYTWLAYLMTFAWGLQDSSVSIHLDAILGFEFTSNKEPFAIDVLLESTTVFVF